MSIPSTKRLWPLVFPALLAGCAALPADRGRGDVAALLKERQHDIGEAAGADTKRLVAELSAKPMAARDVVRLALVNNPSLRAQYAELGIAAAEVYDAGRLSNPTLSASVLFPNESGSGNETTFGLAQSFTDLLLLPARNRFAEGEFERAKLAAASAILDLAADAQAGYFELVGAQQVARMRQTVAKAAGASAELAKRFFDAGNITRLELAREQAAATQARLDHLQAQAGVSAARASLARLTGLDSEDWSVVEALPLPPGNDDELQPLMGLADRSRMDLAATRKQVSLLADSLGVTRRFRFLGDVEVGIETTRVSEGVRLTGPTLSLQLPLFNQGKGAVARSEAQLQLVESELRSLEIEIASEIRRAHADLQNARLRIEQYRTALIPQREEIVRRTQEQVNYMLVGQFELLLSKQQEYDAYQGYLEAVRDYWVARAALTRQVGTSLPSAADVGEAAIDVDTLIAPKEPPMQHEGGMPMDHSGHDMKDMKGMDQQAPDKHIEHRMKDMKQPGEQKDHSGHEMPSGMESHIPKTKDEDEEPAGKEQKPSESQPHQHGDEQ